MSTASKCPTHLLIASVWCGFGSAVMLMGFYGWLLYSTLHPPEGWQHIPVEERYEMLASQFRSTLDLLPVAAFAIVLLTIMVWYQLRERKGDA
jgi:hypothetical protein